MVRSIMTEIVTRNTSITVDAVTDTYETLIAIVFLNLNILVIVHMHVTLIAVQTIMISYFIVLTIDTFLLDKILNVIKYAIVLVNVVVTAEMYLNETEVAVRFTNRTLIKCKRRNVVINRNVIMKNVSGGEMNTILYLVLLFLFLKLIVVNLAMSFETQRSIIVEPKFCLLSETHFSDY